MMRICISELVIIGSDNGLWSAMCQAITWTNAEILFFWPEALTSGKFALKLIFMQENELKMLCAILQTFVSVAMI